MKLQGRAGGIAGQVLGGIADGDQGLLEHAAVGVVDGEARLVDPLAQVIAHAPLPRQLFQERLVLGDQPELALDPLEPDPAIAADQVAQVRGQVRRQGELRVGFQSRDHLIGGHPGGGGVPEGKRA